MAIAREPIEQVVGYVITANMRSDYNVPFCAWTNGDVWRVFDIAAQKVVLDVQISLDEPADCAFKLLGLWRPSFGDGSLRSPVKLHAEERTEPQAKVAHSAPEPARESGGAGTLVNFDVGTDPMPKSIAFPGESAQPIRKQWELIVSVANYLVRTERLTADNGTFRSGSKRYIVHSVPKHPSGKASIAQAELENGLYVETSNTFEQQVKYALKLLEHYGQSGLARRVKLGW